MEDHLQRLRKSNSHARSTIHVSPAGVNYCIGEAFIEPYELDAVVFYDNPMLTFDRVAKNAVVVAPSGRDQFVAACRSFLGTKGSLENELEASLGTFRHCS